MTSTAVAAEPLIPGWFHHGAKLLDLIERHRPVVCVELGTWMGASAIPIARAVRRWGGTVTCVDTWAGELNADGGSQSGRSPLMLWSCGRVMVEAGISASVRLIPAMIVDAAASWTQPIDFLYVDADHSYRGVMADLGAWVPHVRAGGLIAGDDYGSDLYPDVALAWDTFAREQALVLTRYQSHPPERHGVQLVYTVIPRRDANG